MLSFHNKVADITKHKHIAVFHNINNVYTSVRALFWLSPGQIPRQRGCATYRILKNNKTYHFVGRSILPAQEAGDSRSCLYWNSPYFPHYHRIPPQTAILLLFKVPFVFNNPIRYNPLSYRERLSVIMN